MKRNIFCIVFSLFSLSLFAQEAPTVGGWYFRLDAGYSSARDPDVTIPEGSIPADLGSSPLFGAGVGLTYVRGIRTDVTVTYRSGFEQITGFPEMPSGQAEFKSMITLLSLYLDLFQFYGPSESETESGLSTFVTRIAPYAGFGIGFSRNELGQITIRNPDGSLLGVVDGKTKSNFAYQLCAGLGIQLSSRILIDVGYHFVKAGDYESEDLLTFPDGSSEPGKDSGSFGAHEIILSFQYTF